MKAYPGQKVKIAPAKAPLFAAYYGPEVLGVLVVLEWRGDLAIVRCGAVTLPLPVATTWLVEVEGVADARAA